MSLWTGRRSSPTARAIACKAGTQAWAAQVKAWKAEPQARAADRLAWKVEGSALAVQGKACTGQGKAWTGQGKAWTGQGKACSAQGKACIAQDKAWTGQAEASTVGTEVWASQVMLLTVQVTVSAEQAMVPAEQATVPAAQVTVSTEQAIVPAAQVALTTEQVAGSTEQARVQISDFLDPLAACASRSSQEYSCACGVAGPARTMLRTSGEVLEDLRAQLKSGPEYRTRIIPKLADEMLARAIQHLEWGPALTPAQRTNVEAKIKERVAIATLDPVALFTNELGTSISDGPCPHDAWILLVALFGD